MSGDALVMRGGPYRTGGLRLNQGTTLQPYADERPVLKGTRVATVAASSPSSPPGAWYDSRKVALVRLSPASRSRNRPRRVTTCRSDGPSS